MMENYGSVDVEIILGDFKFHWPVCVAPLREDFLLGCDIFDNFSFTFNTHHGLFVNGEWIECVIHRNEIYYQYPIWCSKKIPQFQPIVNL